MDAKDLLAWLERCAAVKPLVVGDVMLDRYWWGRAQRISPEAPVPVVLLQNSTTAAGGAANVAVNIAGLGARPQLVGLIGNDEAAAELLAVLAAQGVDAGACVTVEGRPTTVKTRIVAQGQHIARLDQEDTAAIDIAQAANVATQIIALLPQADVIIFSDYGKGFLTPELLQTVIAAARRLQIPVLVDPKGREYGRYAGATLLTPNRKEAAQAAGFDENEPDVATRAGRQLLETLAIDGLLITQGEDGMTLFRRNHAPEHLTARARAVYDVTGAGDTVIATLALALGAGADWLSAAHLANTAAGLVVEQVGTTAITLEHLQHALALTDGA